MEREKLSPGDGDPHEGSVVAPDGNWLARIEVLAALQPFCSRVSHALRNPLSGVLMNTQMMVEELPESSPLQVYLRDILDGANMMEDIIQLLTEFTSPQTPNPRGFPLRKPATEVIQWAGRQTDPQRVHIHAAYPPGLLEAHADPGQVRNILHHLFLSAIESMPHGGEIRFSCRNISHSTGVDSKSPGVEMEIQDTGKGVTKEHLSKIFDPFFTTREKKIGLGLSIVCLLCELNHGRVFLESREGKGTRVRVHLPAVPPSPNGS